MANANWFNETYYLEQKTALLNAQGAAPYGTNWTVTTTLASITAAGLTAQQHYQTYGWAEGLAPDSYYDETQYINSKVAALNAGSGTAPYGTSWTASLFRVAWATANPSNPNPFYHYLAYGAYEANVNPSTGFNDEAYETAKAAQLNATSYQGQTNWTAASVNTLFQTAGITPIGHYMAYGVNENINYTPTPEPTPGQTYTLTTGTDTITGTAGDDIVNGVLNATAGSTTLNLADTINGAAGVNTFNVRITDGTALAAASSPVLTNIQNLQITNLAGQSTNLLGIAPNLNRLGVSGATASFTSTNVGTAVSTIDIGSIATDTLTVTHNFGTGLTGSADTLAVNASGVAKATTAGTNLAFNLTGGAALDGWDVVNVNSAGTANRFNTFVVNAGGASTLSTLNVSGGTSFRVNTSLDFVNTAGTLNASANTGGVNVVFGTETITAIGGSGNDTFAFNAAGDLTTADSVNGGGGTNTLKIADTAISGATTTLNSAITACSNINTLGFTGATATVDASVLGITDYLLETTAAGNVTFTNIAGDVVTIDNRATGAATFSQAVGTTDFTLNIKNSGTAAGTAGLTVTGFNTININSTGNAGVTNVLGGTTNNAAALFNITGSANLNMGTAGSQINVNASTFTGNLTVTGSAAADSLIGGSGADTLLGGTGADVITGGAGNDSITGGSGASKDVINGGTGTNTYNLASTDSLGTGLTGGAVITSANLAANGTSYDTYTVNATDVFTVVGSGTAVALADKGTTACIEAGAAYFSANGAAAYWNDGTNTYVVFDTNENGVFNAATDNILVINGVHTLSATVAAATWTITVTS